MTMVSSMQTQLEKAEKEATAGKAENAIFHGREQRDYQGREIIDEFIGNDGHLCSCSQ